MPFRGFSTPTPRMSAPSSVSRANRKPFRIIDRTGVDTSIREAQKNAHLQEFHSTIQNLEAAEKKKTAKNIVLSALATIAAGTGAAALGAGGGFAKLANMLGLGGLVKDSDKSTATPDSNPNAVNDAAAIAALKQTGALGDKQSSSSSNSSNSLANLVSNVLGGNNSMSSSLDGIMSVLGGLGSQYASTVLNYENQVKLIDKQNDYNTPAAQMQRFKDAGLNPNLIYGMGNNGNQPASGSIAPVDFDTSQRENRLAKFGMALQLKQFQVDNALKMAQVDLLNKQGMQADQQTEAQRLSNSVFMEQYQVQLQQMKTDIDKMIEEKRNLMSNTKNQDIRNQYEAQILRLEMQSKNLEMEYQKVAKHSLEQDVEWKPWLNGADMLSKGFGSLRDIGLGLKFFGIGSPKMPKIGF